MAIIFKTSKGNYLAADHELSLSSLPWEEDLKYVGKVSRFVGQIKQKPEKTIVIEKKEYLDVIAHYTHLDEKEFLELLEKEKKAVQQEIETTKNNVSADQRFLPKLRSKLSYLEELKKFASL